MSYQSCNPMYSALESSLGSLYERAAQTTLFRASTYELPVIAAYASKNLSYSAVVSPPVQHECSFAPELSLNPRRAPQPFVGDAAAVEQDVKEAFWATTAKAFPSDIRVAVMDNRYFARQVAHPGIVGFSLNRKDFGMVSDVVVRAGAKDHLMLTIGHEIGHVLSRTLSNKHCEEAKAFAFSRAWMKNIRDKNIAGLRGCIILDNPAQNGLHDAASAFVWRMLASGYDALQLYWDIAAGRVPYVI